VAGKLTLEGDPGDYVVMSSPDNIILVPDVLPNNDGLPVGFPPGKASLHDLSRRERKQLADFVTNKARKDCRAIEGIRKRFHPDSLM
jgi:hypothetical protein